MALVARNVLRGGRRGGIATSGGVAVGLALWSVAASIGLATLLRTSEPAFVALKVVGSAYLLYLGARSLFEAIRTHAEPQPRRRSPATTPVMVSLRQGLISNLGNPKIAVFFTSFLPQFVPGPHPSAATLLTLGLLFCAITLAWLIGYSLLVARAGDLIRRTRIRRALDAMTGLILLGLGTRLALERRA
jgi:threonine/homoserine/homoserine lactone efflux protein